jgi:NADH:ubiquinone oxidoreductase subunit 3 (subunit A)
MQLLLPGRKARFRLQKKKESNSRSQSPAVRRALFLCRCGFAAAFLLLVVVSLIFIVFDTEPLFQRAASIVILGVLPAITIWACAFLIFQALMAINWLTAKKMSGLGQAWKLRVSRTAMSSMPVHSS